jgi:hypothetical protein
MIFGAVTFSAAAHAAPAQSEYATLSLALATDLRCGLLNVMEHEALKRAVSDLERQGGVRASVQALDCASDAAAAAVSAGRPAALLGLAIAAVTAASIAPLTTPFTPREQELALALNTYLDRVLGADAPQYIDPAQNSARAAIEANAMAARDRLDTVLADAAFQAAAESAGYRATVFADDWIRLTDNGSQPILIGRLNRCSSADAAFQGGFECYLMLRNGAVSAFFRDAPRAAQPMPVPGVVRLYVRKPDAAVRTAQGEPVANTPAWRNNAIAYEGVRSGAPFLGATVFDFGPAASAALMNQTPNDEVEIAVASAPNVPGLAGGRPLNLFRLEGLLTDQRLRRAQ